MHEQEPHLYPRPLELREQDHESKQEVVDKIDSLIKLYGFSYEMIWGKQLPPQFRVTIHGPSTYLEDGTKIPIEIMNSSLKLQRVPLDGGRNTYAMRLVTRVDEEAVALASVTVDSHNKVTEMQLRDMPDMNRINWVHLLDATTVQLSNKINKDMLAE